MKFDDFISKFDRRVKTSVGFNVLCPSHTDKSPSLQVCEASDGKILLKCFAGCSTESVVRSLGLQMRDLFPNEPARQFTVPAIKVAPVSNGAQEKPVIEAIYSYENELGKEVYQAIRLKPKSFRQRHRNEKGEWVWTMEGVERVLYRLPEVLKAQEVWIVEGEKDVNNLVEIGFCATCNVGGAGKWLDAYTETLAGKDVIICGDNDKAGKEHVQLVFDSIAGKAKTVRIVTLPDQVVNHGAVKDVSDFIATFKEPKSAYAELCRKRDLTHPFVRGLRLPIYTMSELESSYQRHAIALSQNSFSLSKWLPSFSYLRPLVCGELVFLIGDTGTGKTGLLQQIARAALPLPTLMFELELPSELLFERFVSNETKMTCQQIEEAYSTGDSMKDRLDLKFKNLFICTESRLSLEDFENYIYRSELKIGEKPKVVLIDYIQLVSAKGISRREKVSDVAEGLKILAKATQTIIIVASQVRRPSDDDPEIGLHSAKESGSIESSCGLLIGAWRDKNDSSLMHLQVLKSTKGGSGLKIECNFDGARMLITERSKISEESVPRNHAD